MGASRDWTAGCIAMEDEDIMWLWDLTEIGIWSKYTNKEENFTMRQRKVKNEEERLAEHHKYLIEDPKAMKGKWQEFFKIETKSMRSSVAAKGKFIMTLAEQNPDRNYIAVEGRGASSAGSGKGGGGRIGQPCFRKGLYQGCGRIFRRGGNSPASTSTSAIPGRRIGTPNAG